jgi:hypothetical protein
MLPLLFDFHAYLKTGEIILGNETLIIQYNGTEKATVLEL